jgi:hypothetical protein
MTFRMLGTGRFEQYVHSTVVSHHLIEFARESLAGLTESSFYAPAPTRTLAAALDADG